MRRNETRKSTLYAGLAIIYATIGPELFSELFRTVDGQRALQLLASQIFDFQIPDLAALVTAAVLSGLDFSSHLVRIDPVNDARDIMGLVQDENFVLDFGNASVLDATDSGTEGEVGLSRNANKRVFPENSPLISDHDSFSRPISGCTKVSTTIAKIFVGLFTEEIILNQAMMNAIAVFHIATFFNARGELSLDNAKLLVRILGPVISGTEIICNNFLSIRDAIRSVDNWIDFKNSSIYWVTKHNKKAALMAVLKIFVNHSFNGAVHYLITKQFFWGVFPYMTNIEISPNTSEYIGYSSAISALIAFTLLRTTGVFENYRAPFLIQNENRYNISLIQKEDRARAWADLNFIRKVQLLIQPVSLGLIRGSAIGYIAYKGLHPILEKNLGGALPEILSGLIAAICATPAFVHAVMTEKEQALNQKIAYEETSFSVTTYLSTAILNIGSQSIRGLIGLIAVHQMLSGAIGDELATALGLGLALETGLLDGMFFQKQMTMRVAQRGEQAKIKLSKFGSLLCTSRRPEHREVEENEDGFLRKSPGF